MKNTAKQIENMKKQTIGVEVEMNSIRRSTAARIAAGYFGTGRYEDTRRRNGYATWSAWDEQDREWKFQRDVSISGPESAVNQVSDAYAELNVEGATTNSSSNVALVLRDKDNNVLDLNNIELGADHVYLVAEVLATKEVPITVEYSGTPAEGYLVVGKPEQDVSKVLLAGNTVNRISKIAIPGEKIDVTGATEDVTVTLNLRDFLPENIRIADSGFNGRITVTVTIKASRERSLEIVPSNISFVNIPEGFVVSLPEEAEERRNVTLRIFGLKDPVNALRAASVTGTADILGWMNQNGITELKPGRYDIPVNFNLGSELKVLESGTIRVDVKEAVAPEE